MIFLLGEESLGVIAAAPVECPAPSPTHIYGPSSFPVSCQMDLQLVEETLHSHLSSEKPLGCLQGPFPRSSPLLSGLTLTSDLHPSVIPHSHCHTLSPWEEQGGFSLLTLWEACSLGITVLFLLLLQDS